MFPLKHNTFITLFSLLNVQHRVTTVRNDDGLHAFDDDVFVFCFSFKTRSIMRASEHQPVRISAHLEVVPSQATC